MTGFLGNGIRSDPWFFVMLRIWASDAQRCLLKKGTAMEFPHEKSGGVRVTTRVLGWFLGPLNTYILEVG